MSGISVRGLSVSYTDSRGVCEAVKDLSLDVPDGQICSIVGPSGCGKSSLLYVLAGIIRNYTGEVLVDGVPPDPSRISVGLIPQNYGLLPWKRVVDNIFLPAKVRGVHLDDAKLAEANEVITALELNDKLRRYPSELSGGERQRVALARAFVNSPDILLMDEPFSALDTVIAARSKKIFMDLWNRHRVTAVLVTHNVDEAVRLGQRIVLMSKSPGRVVEVIDNSKGEYFSVKASLERRIEEEWI